MAENDITSKITDLLNDPESMKKFGEFASGFLNSSEKSENQSDNTFLNNSDISIDPSQMGSIIKIVTALKKNSSAEDDNTRLLTALKPHLSKERGKKIDKAVSLMRIAKLLPVLKESGIMNLLGE